VQQRLAAKGGTILAISADTEAETRAMAANYNYPFPLLSDPDLTVIRKLGVLHPGGKAGQDIAAPTHLLLDSGGRVVWRFMAKSSLDWVDLDEELAAIDKL
jgi:peroxiredoxin